MKASIISKCTLRMMTEATKQHTVPFTGPYQRYTYMTQTYVANINPGTTDGSRQMPQLFFPSYCILYPRNRAGSPNRKLLCSEPDGNGLYRPSHLFYFLENDEGPSSIAPSHQSSLHWNHHSTHIRGIIWLQLCSTIIVGLCRTN